MFRIADGRECFYQWDLDRQIIVEDPTITEVHFCNRTDECSLVVEVEETTVFADAKEFMTLRTANVPNVILQKSFDIRVFGYDGKATRHDEVFKVKARTKPTDYVYTETEVKNYDDLVARVDEIEKNGISEEAITGAVENYLEKNPIDLTGYATEEYVDEAVKNIDIPDVDLTGYATEKYVDDAIAGIELPEAGDSNAPAYALVIPTVLDEKVTDEKTIECLDTAWNTGLPFCTYEGCLVVQGKKSGDTLTLYAVQQPTLASSKTFYVYRVAIRHGSLSWSFVSMTKQQRKYATNTSDLENDSNFVDKTYVDEAIAGIDIPSADLTNYYTKEETAQAIQDALNAIGVAEGGAY
jgi:hypothetical protein